MTMRERLIRAMQESPAWPAVFQAGTADALLDAILAELMEPGEGARRAGSHYMIHGPGIGGGIKWPDHAGFVWQAMLTHIREER